MMRFKTGRPGASVNPGTFLESELGEWEALLLSLLPPGQRAMTDPGVNFADCGRQLPKDFGWGDKAGPVRIRLLSRKVY